MSETTPLKLIPRYLSHQLSVDLHKGWGPIGPFFFTAGPLTGLVQAVTATMSAWVHQFVQKTLGLLVLPDCLLFTIPPHCPPPPFSGGPESGWCMRMLSHLWLNIPFTLSVPSLVVGDAHFFVHVKWPWSSVWFLEDGQLGFLLL